MPQMQPLATQPLATTLDLVSAGAAVLAAGDEDPGDSEFDDDFDDEFDDDFEEEEDLEEEDDDEYIMPEANPGLEEE